MHSFDPLFMNVSHHVDALVFKSPHADLHHRLRQADQQAASAASSSAVVGELSLRKSTLSLVTCNL